MFVPDHDGTFIDTYKRMLQISRFTWLLAILYNTLENRPDWFELVKHGIGFIGKYGFDGNGRTFFQANYILMEQVNLNYPKIITIKILNNCQFIILMFDFFNFLCYNINDDVDLFNF